MDVRPYHPADRPGVLSLAERLLVGMAPWNDLDGSRAAIQRWVCESLDRHDDDHPVFVAVDREEVLAFVSVSRTRHFTGREEAHVGELAVAEAAARSGIGRALMSAAEQWAVARGLPRVSLETGVFNDVARRFYAAMGYVEEEVRLSRAVG